MLRKPTALLALGLMAGAAGAQAEDDGRPDYSVRSYHYVQPVENYNYMRRPDAYTPRRADNFVRGGRMDEYALRPEDYLPTPRVQESEYAPGIYFVTGGVSDTGEAAIQAMQRDYDLKLMFAAVTGHYLADVGVEIIDARGNTVINTVTTGPFLLADLKPGAYTVRANYDGMTQTRKITIGPRGGMKNYNIFFNIQET